MDNILDPRPRGLDSNPAVSSFSFVKTDYCKDRLLPPIVINHPISIYGKCMTSIFLMATTKSFQVFLKLHLKFFLFFLNRKLIFVLKQTFFEKKNLDAKFNFLCV